MTPLASFLQRRRALSSFILYVPGHKSLAAFFTELSKQELTNNYALHDLRCFDKWMAERLAIQDILRRNRALAKRAARFVTGTRVKYIPEAFQEVSNSLNLVDELQATAFVEEAQAKDLIARCVLRLAEFTEFMRLAFVVRDGIESSAIDDEKMQLGYLPDLCLRRIRHFLHLSDAPDS
ncbi:hypothetical protein V5799_020929 [Amblyomma americanum]|uniref:Uncharacterized protein n=1 Tax=Amblyomma americanum TaxID=6943 RepID=A0AAQ4ET10_AMBAM